MLKLDLNPKPNVLKQFAFFAVIGLPLIVFAVLKICGTWSWTDSWTHPAMLLAFGLGALQLLLFLGGLRAPTRWLFVLLMVLALPIGFVLSHVLMALIYYLVFTPMGLLFRLFGRDALHRRPDPRAASYWHVRGAQRSGASYFKLY